MLCVTAGILIVPDQPVNILKVVLTPPSPAPPAPSFIARLAVLGDGIITNHMVYHIISYMVMM